MTTFRDNSAGINPSSAQRDGTRSRDTSEPVNALSSGARKHAWGRKAGLALVVPVMAAALAGALPAPASAAERIDPAPVADTLPVVPPVATDSVGGGSPGLDAAGKPLPRAGAHPRALSPLSTHYWDVLSPIPIPVDPNETPEQRAERLAHYWDAVSPF